MFLEQIDAIDRDSEIHGLSESSYVLKKNLEHSLNLIIKEEEIRWFQRAKEKELLEGDALTSYFIAKASGRKRRNKIISLRDEDLLIQGDQALLNYATSFYKNLFGAGSNIESISLVVPIPVVLDDQDRIRLTEPFSLNEIKIAVFQMKPNKSPGLNGLPAEFYQKFWDWVGPDLLVLFNEFYHGRLDIERFNYGLLSLIPKSVGADKLQAYRPIYLLNVIFKFFTKVVNNRFSLVADEVVSPF